MESGFAERALHPIIKMIEGEMGRRAKVPSYGNRLDAVKVLGKIGDSRAVEPLIKALEDEEVRDAAKEALKKLGHEVE